MGEMIGVMSLVSFAAAVIMFLVILLISHRVGTTNDLLKKILKHLQAETPEGPHDELIECAWCKAVVPESTSSNYEGAVICRSCWNKQQRSGS